jgi:DNA repair exonuclease SbcCD ATPase subunit
MCHEKSFVDFSQFQSALIVGKMENNDSFSNGVGKSSIFKAIEYVLFNQADVNLEKIIRDDANICMITFDFLIGEQEYRIIRKRTKKGSTDLTLLQRNSVVGSEIEVYHDLKSDPISDDKFWKDISGRRAADTEKELEKLIKINFKTFRSIVHFVQNDFSGLTTSTPEKRKALFKDALNLAIYSKLEKIAKDRSSVLVKEIDKHKILIDSLMSAGVDLEELQEQSLEVETKIESLIKTLESPTANLTLLNSELSELLRTHKDLESKSISLIEKEKVLLVEKSRLELSVKDYQGKKNAAVKQAKELIDEVKKSKELSNSLSEIDFSEINSLAEQISEHKQKLAYLNVSVQNNIADYEDLKIPFPDDSVCKHCRQPMTQEHKKVCLEQVAKNMEKCQHNIAVAKKEIALLNGEVNNYQLKMNSLTRSKQQLDELNNKLTLKNKELQDKKNLHADYSGLYDKFLDDLNNKLSELDEIKAMIAMSSISEANEIMTRIDTQRSKIVGTNSEIASLNKEIAHLTASRAVIKHNIEQKNKEIVRMNSLKIRLQDLEKKHAMYPNVIQAFSTTGIPNLIIQNVLDDLQLKANDLLNKLRPGLQLSFFIEKTKGDGTESDTLDIHYHVNGKDRYYEQLSGAMKLAVTFSLKIGLNYLLQDIFGTNIKLLLLDEIDQSLDKASVDSFADIVKFFQKDFTILVITHNDRLKNKFANGILVEQDLNMISKARVVNSW